MEIKIYLAHYKISYEEWVFIKIPKTKGKQFIAGDSCTSSNTSISSHKLHLYPVKKVKTF